MGSEKGFAEAAAMLQEGITIVLSRWTATRGSRLQQLEQDLFSLLTDYQREVCLKDVKEVLGATLNTSIQHGTIEEVSSEVMRLYKGWMEDDLRYMEKLKDDENSDGVIVNCVQADAGMAPRSDSDGWIMIAPKKKIEANIDRSVPKSAEARDGWTVIMHNKDAWKEL